MTAREIYRNLVPKPVRAAIRRIIPSPAERPPIDLGKYRSRKSYSGQKVVVAGVFRSGTGLGRAAELVARTLETAGTSVVRVDLTKALRMPSQGSAEYLTPARCLDSDVTDVIVVLNPDNSHALYYFDRNWLVGRCVIGHWIWELEHVPVGWRAKSISFDEIRAPTQLVADSIAASLAEFGGPIEVLPYAALTEPMPKPTFDDCLRARRRYELDSGSAVLGYTFAAGSNYDRKNPEGAINVFRTLLKNTTKPTLLILRCNDIGLYPEEHARLLAAIGGDDRIRLFSQSNRMGLHDFYAVIDVLISPSRAEGYGLTLVEAAQAGVPVVTNGWRLPQEITELSLVHTVGFDLVPVVELQGHYSDVANAVWAEPHIQDMAAITYSLLEARTQRDLRLNFSGRP